MRIYKLWFMTLLLAVFMAGCGSSHNSNSPAGDTTAPTVSSTNPGDTTTGVATQPEAHRYLQRGNGPCNLRRQCLL